MASSSAPSGTKTTIDDVTATFAASLALAGGDVVDFSHLANGTTKGGSQAFLLACPLTRKPCSSMDLQRHFRRIWVLDGSFKVQDRTPNRYVFSFDRRKDRNKVLRGGPWYFNKAPVVIQAYDGFLAPQSVPLETLFFWVRISNIPPALEELPMIMNVASIAGTYQGIDQKLFATSGKIRVHVTHDISKPFFQKKTLKLAPGVVAKIEFFFENLIGKCKRCNLIYHDKGVCQMVSPDKAAGEKEQHRLPLPNPFLGFANNRFVNGAFKFQGIQTPILPPVARNLFGSFDGLKPRKPVVIRQTGLKIRTAETCTEGTSKEALALVPFEGMQSELKRNRPASPFSSPKKIKFLIGEASESKSILPKKLKIPEFHTKFTAKSLGLVEAPGGILISKDSSTPLVNTPPTKKKRGRPLGSKNKIPSKTTKVTVEDGLSVLCPGKPPSPSVKGKETI